MIRLEINSCWKVFRLTLLMLLAFSCSKDDGIIDEIPPEGTGEPIENSKTFIYEKFQENYLWLDELPEIDPNSYNSDSGLVEALRYKEVDRWSFVTDLAAYKALFENAQTKGFGVGMSYIEGEKRLMVRFTYAKAPMGLAGVDRGWEFYKINDVLVSSIENPWEALDTDSEVKFTFITTSNDTVTRSMTRTDYEINTVLHKSIHEVANRKVGYLVYESFLNDTTELDDAFAFFADENIEDLVIDLRYNGGGRDYTAFYLAAQIGGHEVQRNVVAEYVYNAKRAAKGDGGRYAPPPVKNAVNLDRLFFITTKSSASASEMVINSMFPYKEVILIGERTHGKPFGMRVFEEEDYGIVLAPITFQLLNAHGNGHYFDGIPVDHEVIDDIFHAWGDPEEACFKKALQLISGEEDQVALKSARLRPIPVPLERGLQEITGAY